MKRLNLGSGARPLEGYVNVDLSPGMPGVGLVHDLDRMPWPFENDSIDEIVMAHCLEHLADCNAAMREIHRILRPGTRAIISVPHFTWQLAYADPTHKHFFGHPTFFYYAQQNGSYFDFAFRACEVRIEFGKRLSFWNHVIEPLANRFPTAYEQSPLRIFPALQLVARLTK